ncbi:MAG: POTRA domain-containing protein [Phycisphaeraceae bacterium]|nr:POTRA domain-containing protein [Phycisphaeraceae bacterium]
MIRLWLMLIPAAIAAAPQARAQGPDFEGRPVAEIRVLGTGRKGLVLNQIELKAGDPYSARKQQISLSKITRLQWFSRAKVRIEVKPDRSLIVTFIVEERAPLARVKIRGNKRFDDATIRKLVLLRPGSPLDRLAIDKSIDRIIAKYRDSGYHLTRVVVDEQKLRADPPVLELVIREGPLISIRKVVFEGNRTFDDYLLRKNIETKAAGWLESGTFDRKTVDLDVVRLRQFYNQRGYLDAAVSRDILISENQQDAKITFLIQEGPVYTVRSIHIEGARLFSDQQVLRAIPLKVGDVFSFDRQRAAQKAISDLYGRLGHLNPRVRFERVPGQTRVQLKIMIDEPRRYIVGDVIIRGNELTQDRVIRRELRGLEPGRPYDGPGLAESRKRLRELGLFRDAEFTLLGDKEDETRDLLVEVEETTTGSLRFSAGISSDAGVLGAIELTQRNFDIDDVPESIEEFFAGPPPGQSFRGGGQYFKLELVPGDKVQRYSIRLREPYLFDTEFFSDQSIYLFTREQETWTEERFGGSIRPGRRFGDTWSVEATLRYEDIRVSDLESEAPVDVFAVEGDNTIDEVGLAIGYSTVDSRIFPTRGERIRLGVDRVGWMGGDFDFTRMTFDYNAFTVVEEDFIGRQSVLGLRLSSGYIFQENAAPIFERFFAGGHSSFRGFERRGVGPRAVRNDTLTLGDDPRGGRFLFLAGLEYNAPLSEEHNLRYVLFVDSGTVQDRVSLDNYRVAVGTGIRIQIPQLTGQAPFAFDFAFPLREEPGDQTRVFSFSIALPF